MEQRTFCKKFMTWTAIAVAAVMLILGLIFGRVIEANIWEEIGKWIVMTLVIISIFEVFAYILSQFFYRVFYDDNGNLKKK